MFVTLRSAAATAAMAEMAQAGRQRSDAAAAAAGVAQLASDARPLPLGVAHSTVAAGRQCVGGCWCECEPSGLCSDCIPFQSTWTQTQGGNVWEKAGVNVSVVYGSMPPEAYRAATGTNASAASTVSCSVAHLAPGMPDSATETVKVHVSKPAWPRMLQIWAVLAVGGVAGMAAGSARGAAAAKP